MHIDGGDMHAHRSRVLNRHVAETSPTPEITTHSPGFVGLLEALVDGHAGAEDRRCGTPFE